MQIGRRFCLVWFFVVPFAIAISSLTQLFPILQQSDTLWGDVAPASSRGTDRSIGSLGQNLEQSFRDIARASSQNVSNQAGGDRLPIVFITGIFGKVNPYLHLFLKSVRGQNFDVLIVGNAQPPGELPSNVRYFNISWGALLKRVQKVAPKCKVTSKHSYHKINDLKPMFGLLFKEEIAEYDMWGYGDPDLWFGDLTSQVTPAIISQNDIMTMSAFGNLAYGPGTFFRNTEHVNNLFRRASKLCRMLSDHQMWIFDEVGKFGEGTSMNGILKFAKQKEEVRVAPMRPGRDLMWDGFDFLYHPTLHNITCELWCPRGGACRLFQHCWPAGMPKCRRREIVACHFQFGKGLMNKNLDRMSHDKLQALLESEHVFFDMSKGLWIPNATDLEQLNRRGFDPPTGQPLRVNNTGYRLKWISKNRMAFFRALNRRSAVRGKVDSTRHAFNSTRNAFHSTRDALSQVEDLPGAADDDQRRRGQGQEQGQGQGQEQGQGQGQGPNRWQGHRHGQRREQTEVVPPFCSAQASLASFDPNQNLTMSAFQGLKRTRRFRGRKSEEEAATAGADDKDKPRRDPGPRELIQNEG